MNGLPELKDQGLNGEAFGNVHVVVEEAVC
jgi:hypothetical protein